LLLVEAANIVLIILLVLIGTIEGRG